jgi:acetyl-CoA synthetase
VLRSNFKASKELEHELMIHMEEHLGKIARPEAITFADVLPKTRSGKIMRRLLKSRAMGLPDGDLSTMEE